MIVMRTPPIMPAGIDTVGGAPFAFSVCMINAASTEAKPRIQPVDRSIPAAMITKVSANPISSTCVA